MISLNLITTQWKNSNFKSTANGSAKASGLFAKTKSTSLFSITTNTPLLTRRPGESKESSANYHSCSIKNALLTSAAATIKNSWATLKTQWMIWLQKWKENKGLGIKIIKYWLQIGGIIYICIEDGGGKTQVDSNFGSRAQLRKSFSDWASSEQINWENYRKRHLPNQHLQSIKLDNDLNKHLGYRFLLRPLVAYDLLRST